MLLPVCYKYFTLIFMHCWIPNFLTPLVAIRFGMLPDVFNEPFSVSTSVGDFVIVITRVSHFIAQQSHIGGLGRTQYIGL